MNKRDRDALELAAASARIAIAHARSGGKVWDQKTTDAVAKRVEEVTEQLRRVSTAQQVAMPGIRWREAKGMRDVLAHNYTRTQVEILDDVVKNDLPSLISEIETELAKSSSPGQNSQPSS